MTTYFVTRHAGALEWASAKGLSAEAIVHLDPDSIAPGDVVMGTLPVPLVAAVCARGARYLHLTLDVPPDLRGKELSASDMDRFGARLEEYTAQRLQRNVK